MDWTAIVVLAVIILLFYNLREERSVPQLNSQALHILIILEAHQHAATHRLKIADLKRMNSNLMHTCRAVELS